MGTALRTRPLALGLALSLILALAAVTVSSAKGSGGNGSGSIVRPQSPAAAATPRSTSAASPSPSLSPPEQDSQRPRKRRRLAVVTGGTRGIGRGIVERLLQTGDYNCVVVTYNANHEAAQRFLTDVTARYDNDSKNGNDKRAKVQLVQGDLAQETTRDDVFKVIDEELQVDGACRLTTVVHNAGQYFGVTSDADTAGIEGFGSDDASNDKKKKKLKSGLASSLKFGDGSLLDARTGKDDFAQMRYYQRLYGEAYVDVCERSLARMRAHAELDPDFQGSLVGISSPGCNLLQKPLPSYSMPGSGKSFMEHAMRLFAVSAAGIGVNCNILVPGVTRTEAWDKLSAHHGVGKGKKSQKGLIDLLAERVPMKQQIIDPLDIGDAVAFLSRPRGGGRFVTGQTIVIDGGLTLMR